MHRDIKLIIVVCVNFVYSASLLGIVFFYSLMGVVSTDRVGIILTEATGFQRQETMLTANLLPAELHTMFWLSLAGVGFCLILIFLLQHTFSSLYGPGALTFIMFFLTALARRAITGFLPAAADASSPYMAGILERSSQANMTVFIFGILLFYFAFRGDKFFLKKEI
ncbi:MAG: hypothetical protein KGZ79_09250 [Dethiobacter sp.]|jgi:hypothetical protein|nr:hypothetical protein [Dethiobacter sp.]